MSDMNDILEQQDDDNSTDSTPAFNNPDFANIFIITANQNPQQPTNSLAPMRFGGGRTEALELTLAFFPIVLALAVVFVVGRKLWAMGRKVFTVRFEIRDDCDLESSANVANDANREDTVPTYAEVMRDIGAPDLPPTYEEAICKEPTSTLHVTP